MLKEDIQNRIDKNYNFKFNQNAQNLELYPYFNEVSTASSPVIKVNGVNMLNFGSNNYLGLTTHEKVLSESIASLKKYGSGVTGSRLLNGTLDVHKKLENKIANFYNKEASLVFPTGYTTNLGLLSSLLISEEIAIIDAQIHASIYDGLRQARCTIRSFKHNNIEDLEKTILSCKIKPTVCVVEGLYSMFGDAGNIKAICGICEKYCITLIVDEAHSVGVLGNKGRGAAELQQVMDKVDVFTITFSKSLGSCGGAIVGPKKIIEFVKVNAKPFLFTAGNTPASLTSALTCLNLLDANPSFIKELHQKKDFLIALLKEKGITPLSKEGPIISLALGSDDQVITTWKKLMDKRVFCNPVLFPAVKKGKGLIRLSIMRTHTIEQLKLLVSSLESVIQSNTI
jgi:8-amino-7-oxononanoate synthase